MKAIVLLPTGQNVNLYTLKLGLQHSLENNGYKVVSFNPLLDIDIDVKNIKSYFLNDNVKELLEYIFEVYEEKSQNADFILINGIIVDSENNNDEFSWLNQYTKQFNNLLIDMLNAYVILITRHGAKNLTQIENQIDLALKNINSNRIIGSIITRLNAPLDENNKYSFSLLDEELNVPKNITTKQDIQKLPIFSSKKIKLIGIIPWQKKLSLPRVIDLKNLLQLDSLNDGDLHNRRVSTVTMSSRLIDSLIVEMKPGTLFITSADRTDIIIALCFAAQKGIQIAGLILTAKYLLKQKSLPFYLNIAKKYNLPILTTNHKSIGIILKLKELDYTIYHQDHERLKAIKEEISEQIDITAIKSKLNIDLSKRMSPPAFRHYLIKMAQKSKKRIILPEGNEIRILQAASICQKRKIADCVLIGNAYEIYKKAAQYALDLPNEIQIIEPNSFKNEHVDLLIKLRKHKGMTKKAAKEALEDPTVFATMKLYCSDVDGLVTGVVHTTAASIGPALKIIKTKPGNNLVSSVFFMCMEEQVMVYGDCAININPSAETLAEIAMQSANSAIKFGIEPKIAMISYSTGSSGSGENVEKVKKATEIARQKYPDLIIDGPLQYDAATIQSVADQKAPESPVAGKANVLIFPDLNTGNTTYKAVQRSANVLSIGPVLQGLNKPVNDLSRGATVDDIIYTIAITAIQASS